MRERESARAKTEKGGGKSRLFHTRDKVEGRGEEEIQGEGRDSKKTPHSVISVCGVRGKC